MYPHNEYAVIAKKSKRIIPLLADMIQALVEYEPFSNKKEANNKLALLYCLVSKEVCMNKERGYKIDEKLPDLYKSAENTKNKKGKVDTEWDTFTSGLYAYGSIGQHSYVSDENLRIIDASKVLFERIKTLADKELEIASEEAIDYLDPKLYKNRGNTAIIYDEEKKETWVDRSNFVIPYQWFHVLVQLRLFRMAANEPQTDTEREQHDKGILLDLVYEVLEVSKPQNLNPRLGVRHLSQLKKYVGKKNITTDNINDLLTDAEKAEAVAATSLLKFPPVLRDAISASRQELSQLKKFLRQNKITTDNIYYLDNEPLLRVKLTDAEKAAVVADLPLLVLKEQRDSTRKYVYEIRLNQNKHLLPLPNAALETPKKKLNSRKKSGKLNK